MERRNRSQGTRNGYWDSFVLFLQAPLQCYHLNLIERGIPLAVYLRSEPTPAPPEMCRASLSRIDHLNQPLKTFTLLRVHDS